MRAGSTQIQTLLSSDESEFRRVRTSALCRICQEKLTKSSSTVDSLKWREEVCMEQIDSDTQISLGILFCEGNQNVLQDYF